MSSEEKSEFLSPALRRLLWLPLCLATLVVLYKISLAVLFQNPVRDFSALEGSQKRHLVLARETQEDLFAPKQAIFTRLLYQVYPRRTDGVVQPLFPWSVVVFSDLKELAQAATHAKSKNAEGTFSELSDQDRLLYNHGRWLNLFTTILVLFVLGLFLLYRYGGATAISVMILGGLGALIPRSAYFQAEVLYYVFFLSSWILCFSIFKKNSIWKYLLLGVLTGLAYLAKDEIYPLLIGFVFVSVLRCAVERWSTGKGRFERSVYCHWQGRNHFIGLVAMGVMHFMVIGPRLVYSYETYGEFFHSYTKYWAWLDSSESKGGDVDLKSVEGWMSQYGEAKTLKRAKSFTTFSPPSWSNYRKGHDWQDRANRLILGTRKVLHEFLWPSATPWGERGKVSWRYLLDYRGILLGFTALMMLVACGARYKQRQRWQERDYPWFRYGWGWSFLFVIFTSLSFIFIFGWYYPTLKGERFFLALYFPLVFSLLVFGEVLVRGVKFGDKGSAFLAVHFALKFLLLGVLGWRVIELLRYPNFTLS